MGNPGYIPAQHSLFSARTEPPEASEGPSKVQFIPDMISSVIDRLLLYPINKYHLLFLFAPFIPSSCSSGKNEWVIDRSVIVLSFIISLVIICAGFSYAGFSTTGFPYTGFPSIGFSRYGPQNHRSTWVGYTTRNPAEITYRNVTLLGQKVVAAQWLFPLILTP